MRRVIVHWNRAAILSSDLAPMLDICRSMEILANLAVHPDGVTHLMRIEFEEGYGPEALDEIGFLNVIRVDDQVAASITSRSLTSTRWRWPSRRWTVWL